MQLGEQDRYLFREGTHTRLYEVLGSHPGIRDGESGCFFAVWAPNAREVSLFGAFNQWTPGQVQLECDEQTGIWQGFVPQLGAGEPYKYHVVSKLKDYRVDKSDPFGVYREVAPGTASIVWDSSYEWKDADWMEARSTPNGLSAPWSVYEVHLGSWRRHPDGSHLTYREIAPELTDYLLDMGFTHVELLPVMEHPYYPSWGYQVTGFFAPTSRFGTPDDFMYLVDQLHQNGIGVILDWVPSHFPSDAHGLGFFDGTYLYEHADVQRRVHPDWDSLLFNYARGEVRSFLQSSARFWLERFHADALRVDAVASMLYLDYSRSEGEWQPNRHGGREHLEAVEFLRRFNAAVYRDFMGPNGRTGIQTIAEESTAWPLVTRPAEHGGLGFGMKWDMGFMHDTLDFMTESPQHRRFHQDKLTFRTMYAFTENFTLPLSHDEVVHGKGSLLTKMPGEGPQQFANLRLLYGYMWAQPGKKLLFMGGEFGQRREWTHDEQLEWFVLKLEEHASGHVGIRDWVRDLNEFYRGSPAMHEKDFDPEGFEWIRCDEDGSSVLSFIRKGTVASLPVVAVFNFSAQPRPDTRLGVPREGVWLEQLNSDSEHYGGSGIGNLGRVVTEPIASDGHPHSLSLLVPPLTAMFFTPAGKATPRKRK